MAHHHSYCCQNCMLRVTRNISKIFFDKNYRVIDLFRLRAKSLRNLIWKYWAGLSKLYSICWEEHWEKCQIFNVLCFGAWSDSISKLCPMWGSNIGGPNFKICFLPLRFQIISKISRSQSLKNYFLQKTAFEVNVFLKYHAFDASIGKFDGQIQKNQCFFQWY